MDASTRLDSTLREFISAVQKLIERVSDPGEAARPDLRSVEREIRSLVQSLGQQATALVIEGYGSGRTSGRRCSDCGGALQFKALHEKRLTTLHGGTVRLERAYYYCGACRQGCLPLDDELDLTGAELTPALRDVVELLGVIAPFEEASRVLECALGIDTTGERIRRTTEAAGQRCLDETSAPAAPTAEVSDERHYLLVDGGMVPTREGFREAKLGVCFRASDCIEVSEKRHLLVRKQFFGDIADPEQFGTLLDRTVQRVGIAVDGANCEMLGDGAPWIWNLRQARLPKAKETVDWYHAKEHLFTAAHALYGEGTRRATAWAEERADELWKGRFFQLYAALDRVRSKSADARAALVDLRRYLQTNQPRMVYAARRCKGLLVGSGPIEGGIRYVLQGRLKRAGMRWSLHGARRVLALRLVWANNDDWSARNLDRAAA